MRAPDAKRSARETEKARPRASAPTAERWLKGEAERKAALRAGEAALASRDCGAIEPTTGEDIRAWRPRGRQIHKYDECERRPAR